MGAPITGQAQSWSRDASSAAAWRTLNTRDSSKSPQLIGKPEGGRCVTPERHVASQETTMSRVEPWKQRPKDGGFLTRRWFCITVCCSATSQALQVLPDMSRMLLFNQRLQLHSCACESGLHRDEREKKEVVWRTAPKSSNISEFSSEAHSF